MSAPNFDYKQQIDPTAFSAALQRKTQMEFEMKSADQKEKDARIGRILDAVKSGQEIAGNMMKQAEFRSRVDGQKKLHDVIGEPSQSDQVTKPMQQFKRPEGPTMPGQAMPLEATQSAQPTFGRTNQGQSQMARLQQALLQSNPEAYTKEMIQGQFPNASAKATPKEQVHYLTLDDGRTVVSRFSTTGAGFMDMEGKPLSSDVMNRVVNRTYAGDFLTDPVTGKTAFGNKSTGQTQDVELPGDSAMAGVDSPENALNNLRTKAPKVYEKVSTILEGTSPAKNPKLEQLVGAAASSAAANAILLDPEPSQVGLKSLGFHMARSSGSNSQLSDQERETFEQPLALLEKWKNSGWRIIQGDLSPKMRRDLLRLNTLLERKSKMQAEKMLAQEKRRARVESGKLWTPGLDEAFPTVSELIVDAEAIVPPAANDNPTSANTEAMQGIDSIAQTLGLKKKPRN